MYSAVASSAVLIFLFRKFSIFFKNAWLFSVLPKFRYLDFPHVKSGSISHNYTEIY